MFLKKKNERRNGSQINCTIFAAGVQFHIAAQEIYWTPLEEKYTYNSDCNNNDKFFYSLIRISCKRSQMQIFFSSALANAAYQSHKAQHDKKNVCIKISNILNIKDK